MAAGKSSRINRQYKTKYRIRNWRESIRRFTADGAYDHRSVYDRSTIGPARAGTENVVIVIPPRRSALSAGPTDGPWAQREASLERIRKVGRREWQKESGYRQQARVENSFFRYKSVCSEAT